ncbi:hypothetical protein FA95DRAFT_1554691 [Auriscalpium vulgare]|uniref:Uncharacterized protein n=1 Tax=Auriscalpium vulgare TaxID=40419 RepID=A0ACB8S588_9AGAM|nr:hypothetical protein FA95DRAFT_1554691 [Auriscalpium vulgare]
MPTVNGVTNHPNHTNGHTTSQGQGSAGEQATMGISPPAVWTPPGTPQSQGTSNGSGSPRPGSSSSSELLFQMDMSSQGSASPPPPSPFLYPVAVAQGSGGSPRAQGRTSAQANNAAVVRCPACGQLVAPADLARHSCTQGSPAGQSSAQLGTGQQGRVRSPSSFSSSDSSSSGRGQPTTAARVQVPISHHRSWTEEEVRRMRPMQQ